MIRLMRRSHNLNILILVSALGLTLIGPAPLRAAWLEWGAAERSASDDGEVDHFMIKLFYSRVAFAKYGQPMGMSLGLEYSPVPRYSIGWFNQLHDSGDGDISYLQWISTLNLRGYRDIARLWGLPLRGGLHVGLGAMLRDYHFDPGAACPAGGCRSETALVGLGGPGFLFFFTKEVGLTATFLLLGTTLADDHCMFSQNLGLNVTF